MANFSGSDDVLVIGGGVIGLSLAWRARERGMSVTVLERDTLGGGTSQVAAGMLAPVAEAEFGEAGRRVLELGLRSAELWPAFAEQLQAASGIDVGLLRDGHADAGARRGRGARARAPGRLPRLARPDDKQAARAARRASASRRSRRARALRWKRQTTTRSIREPCWQRCAPHVNRRACELREHARVERVQADAGRVAGVALADGQSLAAGQVVLAAGAWSAQVAGAELDATRPGATVPVRPVRGQLLRLRDPAGPGLLSSVIRFEGGYVVPRADGRYVLGATVEERGFDVEPDVGGVYELLREAHEIVPGISELKIEELCVGLRPGTPDNAPAIGAGSPEGLLLGDGPSPQRHPAGAADGAARREAALRRADRRGRARAAGRMRPAALRRCLRRAAGRGRGGARVIMLNGEDCDVSPGETVAAVLARLELSPEARGVAVAVDGEVVPRARVALVRAPRARARRGADGDAGRMMRGMHEAIDTAIEGADDRGTHAALASACSARAASLRWRCMAEAIAASGWSSSPWLCGASTRLRAAR